jgi:tetratricopeptide (TPR) repeat protein
VLFTLLVAFQAPEPAPTFAKDIAPLAYARCAPCHRPGEAAPFALLTHADFQKRAKQILTVVEERYMPPWLPDDQGRQFKDARALSDREIELFRRWVEAGTPEGDPAELPPAPVFTTGWELGEPDLVLEMPETYTLAAEGRDVYRNFVIPSPASGRRYVRALEFDPVNRAAVHHAVLFVDGTRLARGEDRRDPLPGYEAMGLGLLRPPNGQFVSWTPGKGAIRYDEGIGWRLDESLDVVLQLHMRPTGKPEPVRIKVALYFTDEPPTKNALAFRLWSREIDIPPGEKSYVVTRDYTLPVDAQVYGTYPHAHYLGKDLRGWATLPDGTEHDLIHIPSWDFNWQEEYFYRAPVTLPKGSVVHMRWEFDNSAENPFNPANPPVRVRHGFQSQDEMAELQLQVLTNEWDRPLLWHDFVQLSFAVDQENVERGLAEMPKNQRLRDEAFKYCLRRRDAKGALLHARKLLELAPQSSDALTRMGQALMMNQQLGEAVNLLEQALTLEPNNGKAMVQLGRAYEFSGDEVRAQELFGRVLARDAGNFLANGAVGEHWLAKGERAKAQKHFEAALATNPEHLLSLWNLARIDLEEGRVTQANERCQAVLEIAADEGGAHFVLGLIAEHEGRVEDARRRYELAARFEPREKEFLAALERTRAAGDAR